MREIKNIEQLNAVIGGICICNNLGGGIGYNANGRILHAETCRRHCCVVNNADGWTLINPVNNTIVWGQCSSYKLFVKPEVINLRNGNKISYYHCSPKFQGWPHNY